MKHFLAVLAAGVAFCVSAFGLIPPKTVVLTFDDAVKSHIEVMAPLLKECGFGATFFICHAWMNDAEYFMTWEEVAELHRMGFEIGNHTWTHAGFNTPRMASRLAGELALVENELARVGVPKPVTFGWTGNAFGPSCLEVLSKAGYRLARRGMQPEAPYGSLELGPLYNPYLHHPLLIPSAGDAYPDWTLDHFKKVVDRAGEGQAAIVQFHGVPDVQHPWVHTPEERFREYMGYLKEGGFHVIAMRDLLPYLPETTIKDEPMTRVQYPAGSKDELYWPVEREQTLEHLNFWLANMVQDHHYSVKEVMQVTCLPVNILEERIALLQEASAFPAEGSRVKILPYPGGRHPRIGFLDGAIDPLRGTKVSIFPPWENGGYMVLDIPEAIFSNLGLTFLAHTHIPTLWNQQHEVIENRDWDRGEDGSLRSEWRLPNGIVLGAHVMPQADGVDMELFLENGTESLLTELRTQVCVMLAAAPEFSEQNQERKHYEKPLTIVKANDADRYLLLAFGHCGRVWGNEKCPCVHSDPVLRDAAPGARVTARGLLRFYEGADIAGAAQRLLGEM